MQGTTPRMKEMSKEYSLLILHNEEKEVIDVHWVVDDSTILVLAENDLVHMGEQHVILSLFGEMNKGHALIPVDCQNVIAENLSRFAILEKNLAGC